MKDRNANKESPRIAEAGAGISGPEPQGATHKQSRTPRKADGVPPPALASEEDRQFDYSLRPHSFAEFVGQERIKKVLGMSITAARQRGEALDHVLFSAPSAPTPPAGLFFVHAAVRPEELGVQLFYRAAGVKD